MSRVLKVADLHEAYTGASREDAILMANMGAVCYLAVKDGLYNQWSATMSSEDAVRVEEWRSEGRQAMLESVKTKLAAVESTAVMLAIAEEKLEKLRASTDIEVSRRVNEVLEGYRKDYELSKMQELSAMRQRIAASEAKETFIQLVADANEAMKEKIHTLEAQLASLQAATATKSSNAIGRQGEAIVLELLETTVIEAFPYSTVKDMTTIGHAADFHLSVMNSRGKHVKMLIDAKKYKRAVNTDESKKLQLDVDGDEEAHAGLMISTNSAICKMKQFEIGRTPKQKPILYLSLQDMDGELQKEVLCWAIRTLLAVVGEANQDERQKMIDQIELLLAGLNNSVREIDNVIRAQMKSVEGLKEIRAGLVKSTSAFRRGNLNEEEEEEEGCDAILKSTGNRCNKKAADGSARCGNHKIKK